MSHREKFEITTPRSEVIKVHGKAVGGAGSDPTLPNKTDGTPDGGIIATMSRTGVGTFTGTFRDSYASLLHVDPYIVGTTAGLKARFTAIDVAAKTFALTTEVGAVATNMAATDTLYLELTVRNQRRN